MKVVIMKLVIMKHENTYFNYLIDFDSLSNEEKEVAE